MSHRQAFYAKMAATLCSSGFAEPIGMRIYTAEEKKKKLYIIIMDNADLIFKIEGTALEDSCCVFKEVDLSWHLGTAVQQDGEKCLLHD